MGRVACRCRDDLCAAQTPSGKKIEISTLSSLFHIEVNPSEAGNNDYSVIRELLKEIAETAQLDASKQRSFKGRRVLGFLDAELRAVVVITEADKLSKDAQHALRRIMEKYMGNCRYVLCCNSTNKARLARQGTASHACR